MAPVYRLLYDSKGNIVRVAYTPQLDKIVSSTIVKRAAPKPKETPSRHFCFLDLPAELRNLIYEKVSHKLSLLIKLGLISSSQVLENEPFAHLSRFTTDRNLLTDCRLVSVSKQVRHEFLGMLASHAPIIRTTIRNLDFSHVVYSLNRISTAEFEKLRSGTVAGSRVMRIELGFAIPFPASWSTGLRLWLQRMDKPAKRGTGIEFEYVWQEEGGPLTVPLRLHGEKRQEEFQKMAAASSGQLSLVARGVIP